MTEKLCNKCDNETRGCKHEPVTFEGRPLGPNSFPILCINKTCTDGAAAGVYNMKHMEPMQRTIDGEEREVWPIATPDKPTVIEPEKLPLFGHDGRVRRAIAASRRSKLVLAGNISEDAAKTAKMRERVFDSSGDIYTSGPNGNFLSAGQNIFNPEHTSDLVIKKKQK